MIHYLTVLLAVAAPLVLSEPSGLLTIGGPIIGGPGLLGAGYGHGLGSGLDYGYGGYGLGGATVLTAPSSISVQKTIIAHPSPVHHVAVAAPVAIAAPAALHVPSPVAKTQVVGPSGIISAKQSLAGTFATVIGPSNGYDAHGHDGHGW